MNQLRISIGILVGVCALLLGRVGAQPFSSAIVVADLDSSITWYQSLLDIELLNRSEVPGKGIKIANLSLNDTFYLELIEIEGSATREDQLKLSGKYHVQGYFKMGFIIADLRHKLDRLRRMGWPISSDVVKDSISQREMIVLKDPDGNRVQLFGALESVRN